VGVVPDLAQLREPDVHQALNALADLRLLPDQAHREPCRLLELGPHQGLADPRLVARSQRRKCARVGRVALAPLQPALGKVLGLQRVHHRHRVPLPAQMAGQVEPVMATRLHHHHVDRRSLLHHPRVQFSEAAALGSDVEHLPLRLALTLATHRRRALVCPYVDSHRQAHTHLLCRLRPQGSSPCFATALADAPSPHCRRIPITARRRSTRAGL